MKILCVIQRFYPAIGGAENLMKQYLDYLSLNHDVTVYTSNADHLSDFWNATTKNTIIEKNNNYKIHRFEILTPSDISPNEFTFPFAISSFGPFCPKMWESLLNMNEKFDLIIASSFPYDHIIPAFLASQKFNIPFMILPHIHSEFLYHNFTAQKLSILSNTDAIVVNTEYEKNQLLEYNIPSEKIFINSPGISMNLDDSKLFDVRKKFQISPDSLLLLFAGSKSYDKGSIFLINAIEAILEKHSLVDVIFIGPKNDEFTNYLSNKSKNIQNHIFDLGLVSNDDKNAIFNACDIFVMPSRSESFGLVYLEAWLHNKPVIGCKIGPVMNLIDDKKNGMLVSFDNTSELISALETLQNPLLRKQLGVNGHQKLFDNFNSEKLCKTFESICLSISNP